MTKSFFFDLPDDEERSLIAALVDYCAGLSGEQFEHMYMSAGERLTILFSDFGFARETGVGFEALEKKEARHRMIAARPFEELPCLEDALHCAFYMADQYDISPDEQGVWRSKAAFSTELKRILNRLGLIDRDGFWTEYSVPVQLRGGYLIADGDRGCEQGNHCVERLALSTISDMPEAAKKLLDMSDSFSPDHERYGCYGIFGAMWRFGGWPSEGERSRIANLGCDPLITKVVDQILINQHNSYSHPDLE
ncbi:hypothetical protein [Halocynthiibacter styelae]|uniref:Uncharacterized protein n=1 Tax=Halocynthiibacter styelae TaxID=2761955 RepID=A0A8J7LPP2_9RHOB|nr:hypothetical protein [Paenihalocynthiibacter styelae]MBI1493886.1 hypothetical protein [Paenihalocynthiibacter styelae]